MIAICVKHTTSIIYKWLLLSHCLASKHALLKEQWPEGAKAVTEVTKRPKSAGTTFKESMIALVENLKTKEPFYVRCIKPNEFKSPMKFDDERCLHQVKDRQWLGRGASVRCDIWN